MIWLELHNANGQPIWVNMEAPFTLTRSGSETHILVNKDLGILVKETPEQILHMLEERQ